MKKTSQRDYTFRAISEMRKIKGEIFADVERYLDLPHDKLKEYLTNDVYHPLDEKFTEAYRKGMNQFGYAIFSRYLAGAQTLSFAVGRQMAVNSPFMPTSIELGIYDTIENHRRKSEPIEFVLFAKAFKDKEDQSPMDNLLELVYLG